LWCQKGGNWGEE
jgi:hypothetical protein